MRALTLTLLAACGVDRTWAADDAMRPHAVEAAARLNAAFGCELVSVVDATAPAAIGNGVQEVFFTEAMAPTREGLAWFGGGPRERDLLILPKAETVEVNGRTFHRPPPDYASTIVHEWGHVFLGVEHLDAPGEVMDKAGGDTTDQEVMARFAAALRAAGARCEEGR